MAFTIFSLGDTHLFAEVINGVAMLFSNGDLVHGSNPLNLSFGAFFGSMFLLCMMIYKSVFQKHIDIKTLLMPLILYIILTVPKTTLIIDDLYRVETPQKVDNVPIGLAIPAAIVSGMGKVLSDSLEVALYVNPIGVQTVSTKVTDAGFLTPLQMLNAMRFDELSKNHPLLQKAVTQIYASCISTSEDFSFLEYQRKPDAFQYLLSKVNAATGVVTFTVSQAGEGVEKTMNCNEAGVLLEGAMHAHMTGDTDISGLLGANYKQNIFAKQLSKAMAVKGTIQKNSNNNPIEYSISDVAAHMASLTGLSQSQSRAFMSSVVFDPMLKSASNCTANYSPLELKQCTAYITANEQWKEASAASGTSFFKNMRNGQNIMVLIGFMLFPVVVFLLMLQGLGSIKLIAGYFIFMLSNYLWIPFAVIINYFSQHSFQEAMYLLHLTQPNAALTLAEAPQFFETVSSKLAVANNAVGMIPMLTTMLFGGMMWAVNTLTKQMNPMANAYNAKINSPTIQSNPAIASGSSLSTKNGIAATTINGVMAPEIKMQAEASATRAEIVQIQDQKAKAISQLASIAQQEGKEVSLSSGGDSGDRRSEGSGDQQSSERSKTTITANQLIVGTTIGETTIKNKDDLTAKKEEGDKVTRESVAGANAGASLDLNKAIQLVKNGQWKKMGSAVGISASIGAAVITTTDKLGQIGLDRKTVGQDGTYATENTLNNAVTDKNSETVTWNGETKNSTLKNSASSDFIATKLNETIQNSTSGAISQSDKQQAQSLMSKIESLSNKESEAISHLSSLNISSEDIAGTTSTFYSNYEHAKQGFEQTNILGQQQVNNWEELKNKGREQAMLGGQVDQQAIEAIATFIAAQRSGNSEVTLAAFDALSMGSVTDIFRESRLFEDRPTQERFDAIQSTYDKLIPQVDVSQQIKELQQTMDGANFSSVVGKVNGAVINAENLSSAVLVGPKKVNIDTAALTPPDYKTLQANVTAKWEASKNEIRNEATALLKSLPNFMDKEHFTNDLSKIEQEMNEAYKNNDTAKLTALRIEVNNLGNALLENAKESQAQLARNFGANNAGVIVAGKAVHVPTKDEIAALHNEQTMKIKAEQARRKIDPKVQAMLKRDEQTFSNLVKVAQEAAQGK